VISIRDLKVHCFDVQYARALPTDGARSGGARHRIDALLGTRVKLRKGDTLYRAGETFTALYAIRIGSLKTTVLAEDGREQVSGYHMLGDMIGTRRHRCRTVTGCQAMALEDTEVCVLPLERYRGRRAGSSLRSGKICCG
jgi:CRP-like cAMP-binding protein